MNHTLLVILPHPDDESFPMGGTLQSEMSKFATSQNSPLFMLQFRA